MTMVKAQSSHYLTLSCPSLFPLQHGKGGCPVVKGDGQREELTCQMCN